MKIKTDFWRPGPKPMRDDDPRWGILDLILDLPWWANSLLCFAVFLGALACWWWVSEIMRGAGR